VACRMLGGRRLRHEVDNDQESRTQPATGLTLGCAFVAKESCQSRHPRCQITPLRNICI
jgi:hypothetical protein